MTAIIGLKNKTGPQGEEGPSGPRGTKGEQGEPGEQGARGYSGGPGSPGVGVPAGGTAGQVLSKINGIDYNTQWVAQSGGGGGTPGGSDTQVQFNDGGAFGGDSNLLWDKNTDSLNIQTTFKQHPLHVAAATGTQINSVSTASVSLVNETLNVSPTGLITLVPEFPTPASGGVTQNTAGTGFIANGQAFDYRVSPVVYSPSNGAYYTSVNATVHAYTDAINDGTTPFSLVVDPGASVSEQTHWFIERQINGGGFSDTLLHPVGSNYEDSGFAGIASVSAWPSQYQLVYTVPTPSSSIVTSQTNIGSGVFTANGTTYDVEIREGANAGGLLYCEQTGTTQTWTDPNDASTFDLDNNWTAGTGDEQVIRISTDAGSSWTYLFVGSGSATNFVFTGQSNDTTAEAAWTRDIATAQIQYAFKAYARNVAPSGGAVFTSSANTYLATLTTPNVKYMFKHVFTGLVAPGARAIADYNAGITNGLDIAGDFIDPGFATWPAGTTLTPSTFGFTGTAQNREYKLYGYSSGLLIYSPAAFTVSTTAAGGLKYVSGSFSYPSGVTTVKITRSINGAGHAVSKTFTSPTVAFTDDAADGSWAGTTTVAPTAAVPSTSRFDLDRTSVNQASDNITVIETSNTGVRYPSIGFGVAVNRNTVASTIVSRISANTSSGALMFGAGTTEGYVSSAMSLMSWRLGASTEFNLQKSTSNHPTFWAGDASAPLAYFFSAGDNNRGTAYFGQNNTSVGGSSKVVIAPPAGGTIGLHIHRTSGASGESILIDEAGSFRAAWGANGNLGLRRASSPTNAVLRLGAVSSHTQILFDTHASALAIDGGVHYNGSDFLGSNKPFVRMSSTTLGTQNRIPFFAGGGATAGQLLDDADLSFDNGNTLFATRHSSSVGSVSAPAYKFNNDTTGLYAPAANQIGMTVSGVLRWLLDLTGASVKPGTATTLAKVGGSLTQTFADAGSVSTTETDLYSYSVAANTLDTNGSGIDAKYGGIFVNSTSTKQVRAYFDGTLIFDSGALTISASSSWDLEVTGVRVSATVIRFIAKMNTSGASLSSYAAYTQVTVSNFTAARVLKITGTAAGVGPASNDIVAKLSTVNFRGAN